MDDKFWGMFFAFSWVWIPIIAILVGGFTEWLKFKEKQSSLGASTHELEQKVAALEAALQEQHANHIRRLEALEAIATHTDFGDLDAARPRLELPDIAAENQEAAARLARRLRS